MKSRTVEDDNAVNPFDVYIVMLFNSIARKSWTFDAGIALLQNLDILKGGMIVMLFWWQWLRTDGNVEQRRERLLAILLSSFFSLFCARLMAYALPFRARPIHTAGFQFVIPFATDPESLTGWSSFPSDHAALFCTFSFGLFFISRKAGWLTLLYCIVAILLPRIYLGIHWPTDLLAGLGIGAFVGGVCAVPSVQQFLTRPLQAWCLHHPVAFPVLLILVTFELGVLFVDVRNSAHFVVDALLR